MESFNGKEPSVGVMCSVTEGFRHNMNQKVNMNPVELTHIWRHVQAIRVDHHRGGVGLKKEDVSGSEGAQRHKPQPFSHSSNAVFDLVFLIPSQLPSS